MTSVDRIGDNEIVAILRAFPKGEMTYVIANILRAGPSVYARPKDGYLKHSPLGTHTVRSKLEKMERAGIVRRMPTIYRKQICWGLTERWA